jgi:hypothetical protein
LLPVPYFHLVFTLPHVLHGLVAGHPRRMYETLFAAASGTLGEFAGSARHLGGEAAFTEATTGRKRTVHLDGAEFIERFLLHVLPPGFKRIRHYGLLAPARKAWRLAMARTALDVPVPDPAVIESVAAFMQRVAHLDWNACPHCGKGHFVVTGPLPSAAGASARGPPCA